MKFFFNDRCKAGFIPYEVRDNDTIYSIASSYNTDVKSIIEENNLKDATDIKPGDLLCIPSGFEIYPNCRTTNYYIVKNGDTIEKIARYFMVSEDLVKYSNYGIDEEKLYQGMVLCIPVGPSPVSINYGENMLTLNFRSGEKVYFNAAGNVKMGEYEVINKSILGDFDDFLVIGLSGKSGETKIKSTLKGITNGEISVMPKDMKTLFNLVPVGTILTVGGENDA